MPHPTIKLGSIGQAVRFLQETLKSYAEPNLDPGLVDAYFGPRTDTAVKAFQKHNGLKADGIVGPKTWLAISAEFRSRRNSWESWPALAHASRPSF